MKRSWSWRIYLFFLGARWRRKCLGLDWVWRAGAEAFPARIWRRGERRVGLVGGTPAAPEPKKPTRWPRCQSAIECTRILPSALRAGTWVLDVSATAARARQAGIEEEPGACCASLLRLRSLGGRGFFRGRCMIGWSGLPRQCEAFDSRSSLQGKKAAAAALSGDTTVEGARCPATAAVEI